MFWSHLLSYYGALIPAKSEGLATFFTHQWHDIENNQNCIDVKLKVPKKHLSLDKIKRITRLVSSLIDQYKCGR